jgi:hypothetical protein
MLVAVLECIAGERGDVPPIWAVVRSDDAVGHRLYRENGFAPIKLQGEWDIIFRPAGLAADLHRH